MTDKELGQLEDLFNDISNDMKPPYVGIELDTVVDVKKVIQYAKEQAERVQELESKLESYRKAYYSCTDTRWEIGEQNKCYREALEFYGNANNYRSIPGTLTRIDFDCGFEARKALELSDDG